jgi:hypothetical protein
VTDDNGDELAAPMMAMVLRDGQREEVAEATP